MEIEICYYREKAVYFAFIDKGSYVYLDKTNDRFRTATGNLDNLYLTKKQLLDQIKKMRNVKLIFNNDLWKVPKKAQKDFINALNNINMEFKIVGAL